MPQRIERLVVIADRRVAKRARHVVEDDAGLRVLLEGILKGLDDVRRSQPEFQSRVISLDILGSPLNNLVRSEDFGRHASRTLAPVDVGRSQQIRLFPQQIGTYSVLVRNEVSE